MTNDENASTSGAIVVTYYSKKMLLTIDLNALFDRVLALDGISHLSFREMSDEERITAVVEAGAIKMIRERLRVYAGPVEVGNRLRDIERDIEARSV